MSLHGTPSPCWAYYIRLLSDIKHWRVNIWLLSGRLWCTIKMNSCMHALACLWAKLHIKGYLKYWIHCEKWDLEGFLTCCGILHSRIPFHRNILCHQVGNRLIQSEVHLQDTLLVGPHLKIACIFVQFCSIFSLSRFFPGNYLHILPYQLLRCEYWKYKRPEYCFRWFQNF